MKILKLITPIALLAGIFVSTSCKKLSDPDVAKVTDSLTVGLVAYYPFDDTGLDLSGNNSHGYVYNINSATDRYGKSNGAYYFDGVSSYIQVKDNQALRLNNTDFTINVWAKTDTYNTSYGSVILGKRGPGNNNGWLFGIHGQSSGNIIGTGQATYQVSGGNDPYAASVKALNTGTWYMLTTVYHVKTQQLSFYVNGVLDNTVTNIPTPLATASGDVYIGRDNPAVGIAPYFYQGTLDEMRIFNRALSISDIKKLFAPAS